MALNRLLRKFLFLSTLSLRRATHYDNYNLHCVEISIHALLAESDGIIDIINNVINDFYPRSPCGERLINNVINGIDKIFLSTLSLRRATFKPPIQTHRQKHFYPRSPCGERPYQQGEGQANQSISIHALLAESDGLSYFYIIKITISIHALLAESDTL